jgi:DNA-binding XRE family transcriptional regulator
LGACAFLCSLTNTLVLIYLFVNTKVWNFWCSMNSENNDQELTLKGLRERLDLSQEGLGRRISLSYRTIAEWESGRKIPRFDNAIALARELGVSLKTLAKAMRLDVAGVPDDEPLPPPERPGRSRTNGN